jgi:hypothetical protein
MIHLFSATGFSGLIADIGQGMPRAKLEESAQTAHCE